MAGSTVHAVDDDAAHRMILTHVLARVAPGLECTLHGGIDEAADAVAKDRAGGKRVLLLCDVHLAGGTVIDLAERLDAAGDDGLRVVALSSIGPGGLAGRLEDAGIDAFVEKPLDLDEMARRLEAVVGDWAAAKAS